MVTSRLYKLALGLVSTVILGAIGSGLWDAVFKPAFPKLVDFMLTISTLGLRELQDGMYVEIARGNYERAGLATFQMITGINCGIIIGIVSVYTITRQLSTYNIDMKNANQLILRRLQISLMYVLCLIVGFFYVNAMCMTYIVRAAG